MLKGMLIAGAGGFLGTCLRYLTGRFFQSVAPSGILPWGTFAVNMLGCLLIGVCCGWAERNGWLSPAVHLFLVTGFCGGFTTFSSFSNELYGQWQARACLAFAIYLAGSLVLGLLCVWLGRMWGGGL